MGTVMSQALAAAIPGLQDRVPLARQIVSAEQVADLASDELERLRVAHEAECVSLAGRLEAAPEARWARGARQALRVLHLHKSWISRELQRRKRAESMAEQKQNASIAAQSRVTAQRELSERQRQAEAARLARIKAANDESAQHVSVFKEVAREVLGAEMYEHLWELTRIRLGQSA